MEIPKFFYDNSVRCMQCYLKPGLFEGDCSMEAYLDDSENCMFNGIATDDVKKMRAGDMTLTFMKMKELGADAFDNHSEELLTDLIEAGMEYALRGREIEGLVAVQRQGNDIFLVYQGTHTAVSKSLKFYMGKLADKAKVTTGKCIDGLIDAGLDIAGIDPKYLPALDSEEWTVKRIDTTADL